MNRSKQNISDLVAHTLAGDIEAYTEIVVHYQDRLYHSLWHRCGSSALAEEYAQEAFFKAYTHLHTFRQEACFYTWLYRIALNVAASEQRSRKTSLPLGKSNHCSGYDLLDSDDSPEQSLERKEDILRVRSAIESLNMEHRQVIELREIEGLDYQSIGRTLGIKIGTVRSRLSRAREQLREILWPNPACQEQTN